MIGILDECMLIAENDDSAEPIKEITKSAIDKAWIIMLEHGDRKIKQAETQLKQAYTDRFNDGMAFGL